MRAFLVLPALGAVGEARVVDETGSPLGIHSVQRF